MARTSIPVTAVNAVDLAVPRHPTARPAGAPAQFHVLAKPSGPICNLDCEYCYFLEKEAMYPGDRFRMSESTLERYIRQLLESEIGPTATISWQGGEPTLLGLDFYRRAMDLVERYRRPGQIVEHTIQTNGTLLDDAWCEFFAQHRFLVGISLDGPADQHDAFRRDKRGRPTHARVVEGLRLLQRHGVDVNVLCTVNRANQNHALEVYRYFRDDLGLRHIQFIPIVEFEGDAVSERSVEPAMFGSFLNEIFDEWVVRDVGTVFVSHFDSALAAWVGARAGLCVFAETCGDALVLEHNGDVYSCDHFVEPEHLLGNLNDIHLVEMVGSVQQRAFGDAKRDSLPEKCRSCDVLFACRGECPKNRRRQDAVVDAGVNYLCDGLYSYFSHVRGSMALMAQLLRDGRYADEVMAIFHSAGRNEDCPCGSGIKAKHCHQRPRPR